MTAHSIAERHPGFFVCLCGEEIPVTGTTRDAYSRAFWTHTNEEKS